MCAPRVTQHTSMCVWQELEHRVDVCHVTRGAQVEHL